MQHHVLITTTFMNPNTEATSVSTALLPCASYDEAELVTRNVWDQRNGGNAAPNGVAHDAIILGNPAVATARDTELEELRAKVEHLESMRPHWAQGYTSDGVAAQASTGALASLWILLGATNQTQAVQKLRLLLGHHPGNITQQAAPEAPDSEQQCNCTQGQCCPICDPDVYAPRTTTASASGECKACEGSGYIETGIDEAPTTLCPKCDASGRTLDVPPEPRVWQMPEGASLTFSIKAAEPMVLGIRATVSREPTVGKWYAGVDNSQPLALYGATARYEGEGRWYLGTGNRIDLYQYDYLQELV